jgi:hypothetical protein
MKGSYQSERKEVLIGVVVGATAVFYLISSGFIPQKAAVSINANVVPNIYGIILAALAALQVAVSVKKWVDSRKKEASADDLPQQTGPGKNLGKRSGIVNVALVAALIIVYCLVLRILGFILSSIGMLYGLSMLLTPDYAKKRYVVCAIFSILLPVVTYYVFNNALNLLMPRGILF